MKRKGSSWRAWCQAGTEVLAISAPVYDASGIPRNADATCAPRPSGPSPPPLSAWNAAGAVTVPNPARIHEPTLMGEVTLNIRSMFRNRDDTPRSLISSAGLTTLPPSATSQARCASASSPRTSDSSARPADAPASPPT